MNELLTKVVNGAPLQEFDAKLNTIEYTILCAQTPDPKERVQVLLKRLTTSTEASAAKNISQILSTCIEAKFPSDEVEDIVEGFVQFASEHPNWPDALKWICAFIHYYCTNVVTVSIFAELNAPEVAVLALKDFMEDSQLVLASSALISHFYFHNIGNAITQLCKALQMHHTDASIIKSIGRTLENFTFCFRDFSSNFFEATKEFIDAGGIDSIESVLKENLEDKEIVNYCAGIIANVTSSGNSLSMNSDSDLISYFFSALSKFADSEQLCGHVLRISSSFPNSRHINWDQVISIFKNTESQFIAFECIHFLSSVAINVKEKKAQVHSTGCVPRVLELMQKYPTNAAIQGEACSLLSYLSFDSETITSSITESDGILLVLNAMKNFPEDEDLLMTACAALSGLTFNNLAGQQVIIKNNGVTLILDSMRNGKKARLQENGCLAIGTMCWNSELKEDVVRLGGVQVIMKALDEHYTSSGLVKNACRALAQVAFNSERYRDDMSAKGVIPLVIRGMEYHPNYDRAQMHGCVALSYLSWTNEGNAAQITANRGYKVVVDAMRNHPSNYEVQEHACRALANISAVSVEDSAAALEQIIAAMRRHEFVSEVQEEACRAIVTLSLVSPANKDKLFELKGADCVVAAMKNFPNNHLVQQEACNALAHLAYEHANLNKSVTDLNGVELLLAAMKTHTNSPKVQLNACGGLSALAFDNTIAQKQIDEFGGVGCVIRAMESFERLRMLELGCSVLGTLAWSTEIKEKVAVVAIPVILKAMRIHQDSPLLQKSTCRAISQFAFNSEKNRQLLTESGAIPLIVGAMRAHVGTEKLIVHGLKALTYLCWENSDVAQTIIQEDVESVLQKVVEIYPSTLRVYNEAIHLSKILFRKTTGSQSPNIRIMSPPAASPIPVSQTPGPNRYGDYIPQSPPSHDAEHNFYSAPNDGLRGPTNGSGRGQGRWGQRRRVGPIESYDRVEDGTGGRFPRKAFRGRGNASLNTAGDLWDDPDPSTYHGNRKIGEMNWQQNELARQEKDEYDVGGAQRGGRGQDGRGRGFNYGSRGGKRGGRGGRGM